MVSNADAIINSDHRIKIFKKKAIQIYQVIDHIKTSKNYVKTMVWKQIPKLFEFQFYVKQGPTLNRPRL